MIAWLSLLVWVYLCLAHGRFWRSEPELQPAVPAATPDVDIVVPARDEAATIVAVIESLLAQDYQGRFRVILVDDGSTDDTGSLPQPHEQLCVVPAGAKPPGWSGKLWAVARGVSAGHAPILLLTDADIVHDPRHLSALMAKLLERRAMPLDMVSEMVRLHCESPAERALVPAFVYFFQMLYPFAEVNDPRSRVAAAAGGTVLIRRAALERIGGIESIRGALIDDVTLARAVKAGGAIHLGHSGLARSIRRYPRFADLWDMIARTAFTQLRHSLWWLALTLAGLALVWWVPVWAMVHEPGWRAGAGAAAFAIAAWTYWPTLARYERSRLWSLALPLIALFFMAATVGSALDHWRGAGARWKSRQYGETDRG